MSRYVSRARDAELAQRRADRAAERAVMVNPYNVGDLLVNTWGYEQTNADFYEVVAVGRRTVTLRPIAYDYVETTFMSGRATPRPGDYTGEPIRKTIQPYPGHEPYLKTTYGWMSRYERPVATSHYA